MTDLNSIDIKSYRKLIKQGIKYLKKDKNSEAIRIFERMLEIDPQDYGIWWYKGFAHSNLDEEDIAIKCFEKYINLHPENPCKKELGLGNLSMKEVLLEVSSLRLNEEERKKFFESAYKIEQMDFNLSESSLARKKRSEEIIKKENIPFIESLPAIEDETQALRRSKEEVANRCLCLLIVALKGEGLEDEYLIPIIEQYREIGDHFTDNEILFQNEEKPDEETLRNFSSWRYESTWVLLWSLGYIEDLGKPDKMTDITPVHPFLNKVPYADFISNAHLRPISEILDYADLIYRYDWATVDAEINNKPSPGNLNAEVLYEWHYTFNWLIGHKNQDWDNITTDT